MKVRPGRAFPLGATWDGEGTNFSLFSQVAESVELCLFDEDGAEERLRLEELDAWCWHGQVPGVGPGRRYGYRVHGPWDPSAGLRCNPNKLLLDPYAKAIDGQVDYDQACFAYNFGDEQSRNDADSAAHVPRSVVIDPGFDWAGDRRPDVPLDQSVIYEVHVKGFTARHPDVPTEQRGTYTGLAHPAVIEYLTRLGVTAVELLPVHQFVHESQLIQRGLRNYWGYNTIGFLAPHDAYSATGCGGRQVPEFKAMVRALHAAGIEVILDVVYNHTAEGNQLGPTLSFKGIDNTAYYRLVDNDRRYYYDTTGTGNSLNVDDPNTLRLIMGSLQVLGHRDACRRVPLRPGVHSGPPVPRRGPAVRVLRPGVAGPGRLAGEADRRAMGPRRRRVPGRPLPPAVVGVERPLPGHHPRLLARRTGRSPGVRLPADRQQRPVCRRHAPRPLASVNFVTAHDGFTMHDLVSYNDKHNETNGEGNADGESNNRSWNCGAEGQTADPVVLDRRQRQQRNFLATLLLSQGVPMLLGGDEIGRTQRGNNNGYCQDNEISWFDWAHPDTELLDFTRRLVALRREHTVLRRKRWFSGRPIRGTIDLGWYRPDGDPMSDQDWHAGFARTVGMFLNGQSITEPDADGNRIVDDSFLLLFNADPADMEWVLPKDQAQTWEPILDTTRPVPHDRSTGAGATYQVRGRSVVVLRAAHEQS